MSDSPKLSCGCAATEPVLRPIVTVRSEEEDDGKSTSPLRDGDGNEGCHTPTSEESKLPSTPLNCPPAPRKRRRIAFRRRRPRPDQVEFIVVGAKEMEQLFSWIDQPPRHAKRQRRDGPDGKESYVGKERKQFSTHLACLVKNQSHYSQRKAREEEEEEEGERWKQSDREVGKAVGLRRNPVALKGGVKFGGWAVVTLHFGHLASHSIHAASADLARPHSFGSPTEAEKTIETALSHSRTPQPHHSEFVRRPLEHVAHRAVVRRHPPGASGSRIGLFFHFLGSLRLCFLLVLDSPPLNSSSSSVVDSASFPSFLCSLFRVLPLPSLWFGIDGMGWDGMGCAHTTTDETEGVYFKYYYYYYYYYSYVPSTIYGAHPLAYGAAALRLVRWLTSDVATTSGGRRKLRFLGSTRHVHIIRCTQGAMSRRERRKDIGYCSRKEEYTTKERVKMASPVGTRLFL
ncbi:hypothetical protein BHM03_00054532 [Ensete ventricosum]|nr:hypothetical protein BHM03_00054532 [Ensete ventricosum]